MNKLLKRVYPCTEFELYVPQKDPEVKLSDFKTLREANESLLIMVVEAMRTNTVGNTRPMLIQRAAEIVKAKIDSDDLQSNELKI